MSAPAALRLSPNLHNPLKIFVDHLIHLSVFLLGTENIVGVVREKWLWLNLR